MRDRSKQLLVINTGKKESEQTRLPAQSGTTHIIGGGGLSVNMTDYLLKSIWDKVFEIRTDSQGTEYIFGKLPMVTQYGITMYSGDGVNVPSLASGLPFDGRTIWYNPNTQQIEVIVGTGGGSGEGVSNFWDLSGIPSWITNSKPKYTYSEITGAISTTELQNYLTQNSYLNVTGGDNRYLQLSGGTISGTYGALTIHRTNEKSALIKYSNTSGDLGYLGFNSSKEPFVYKGTDTTTSYKIWHSGNFKPSDYLPLNGNASSATKLQTARIIWGQSFDGTNDVDGRFTMTSEGGLPFSIGWLSTENTVQVWSWASGTGFSDLCIGASKDTPEKALYFSGANGYWGVGTVTPEYKLHVVGTLHIDAAASFGSSITLKGTGSSTARLIMSRSGYNYINYPADGKLCFGTSNSSASTQLFIDGATGNVGIGTVEPSAKFHVKGTSNLRGTIYATNADATTMVEDSGKIKFNSLNTRDDLRSPYIQAMHQSNYSRKRLSIFQSNATNYTDDFVEVFTVLPNGNVGIGTTSPSYKLHVIGDIGNENVRLRYSTSNPFLSLVRSTTSETWYVQAVSGYLAIGSTSSASCKIDASGNLLSPAGITMYSDRRKKTILNHVELSLKQIADAPLIEHYYNSDEKKTTHVGSIAQYWASMNDWFCKLDSEGYYTMEIQNAALASAISIARELDRYETKTDKAIKKLKNCICELEEEVERLKSA